MSAYHYVSEKYQAAEETEIKEESSWDIKAGHFIARCTQKDKCKKHFSLAEAQQKCLEDDSCKGVVLVDNNYFELRAGPQILKSNKNETSWILKTQPCTGDEEVYLDLDLLEKNYPNLKGLRRRSNDGKYCIYPGFSKYLKIPIKI